MHESTLRVVYRGFFFVSVYTYFFKSTSYTIYYMLKSIEHDSIRLTLFESSACVFLIRTNGRYRLTDTSLPRHIYSSKKKFIVALNAHLIHSEDTRGTESKHWVFNERTLELRITPSVLRTEQLFTPLSLHLRLGRRHRRSTVISGNHTATGVFHQSPRLF